ncbi:MAG: SUMF1/EgtB/PvdO family nonheme iron enzyme [Verrucomicrobiales bacterium]
MQDASTTEDGAYMMDAAREAAQAGNPRKAGARYWLPSIDEWIKAAYYDPESRTYGIFPVGDALAAAPTPALASPMGVCSNPSSRTVNYDNSADWNSQNGHFVSVGSCGSASFFGAFDMGGNAAELTETQAGASVNVRLPGGDFASPAPHLSSSTDAITVIGRNFPSYFGFRVAAALRPEDEFRIKTVRLITGPNSKTVFMTFPTHAGCQYQLEISADLNLTLPFSAFGPVVEGTGGVMTLSASLANRSFYFRIAQRF